MTGIEMVGPPPDFSAQFELIDHDGRRVSHRDFLGRSALVYFGFTHCKVVCPRSLTKLGNVIRSMREHGHEIQALYVTVDPERDTPEVMKRYVESNHP
ncbi:SCO family protein [Parasphingorhabdus sp.]|uniref:SCO family protein n=1 Tax=Parasphingorhabdus sp. TaxID=2709688 RepID=UPI0032EF6BA5